MSFESFYGGRMGASFVIVKHFDGISIPENTIHRVKIYATNGNNNNLIYYVDANNKLIEKNSQNYSDYSWKYTELDGSTLSNVNWDPSLTGTSGTPTSVTLDNEYAEGMVQCFAKGGNSTNEVNYGEYVIIDTCIGLHQKSNPTNGIVYRRGINFDNDLAGAEYIGQIVGPEGQSPEFELDTVEDIQEESGHEYSEYTVLNDSLIPGKIDEDTYNDAILYDWCNIKDEYGNIIKVKIGFTFPYLVSEIIGNARSGYYQAGDNIPEGKEIGDIISYDDNFNLTEREDDGDHPFYNKWKINIPSGVKGDSIRNIIMLPVKARENVHIYSNKELTVDTGILTGGDENLIISSYDAINYPNAIEINIEGQQGQRWIKTSDGYDTRIFYKLLSYDEKEAGELGSYILAGYYKNIHDIQIDTGTTQGEGSQKLQILYSTEKNYIDLGNPINYVIDTKIITDVSNMSDDNKKFLHHMLIYYSDPELRNNFGEDEYFYSDVLEENVNGWVDCGEVGEIRGINILATFASVSDIPTIDDTPTGAKKNPEQIGGDAKYTGWAILIGNVSNGFSIYVYNYVISDWENAGIYGAGVTEPSAFITDINIHTNTEAFNGLKLTGFYINHTVERKTAH